MSALCSARFALPFFNFIHDGKYLHSPPGHSVFFKVVEFYSSEFGLKLKLHLGSGCG